MTQPISGRSLYSRASAFSQRTDEGTFLRKLCLEVQLLRSMNETRLEIEISQGVLKQRLAQWKAPELCYPSEVFGKYAAR
jgi:hypothetical protein